MLKIKSIQILLLLIVCSFFITCKTELKEPTIARKIDVKYYRSLRLVDSLILRVGNYLENNQVEEALSISSVLDSMSNQMKGTYPEIRLKTIGVRVELLYDYDLNKDIVVDMENLLSEGFEILEKNPDLLNQSKKIHFWEGIAAFGRRDYENGVNALTVALDLEEQDSTISDPHFKMICYSKIGNLWKGAKEYSKAKDSFQKAIQLSELSPKVSEENQLLLQDLATYYISIGDSLNVFKTINEIDQILPQKRQISKERLEALWYYKRKNYKKSIALYRKVEEQLDNGQLIFQRFMIFDECIWVLSEMYQKIQSFDLAFHYLTKYLLVEKAIVEKTNFNWDYIENHQEYFVEASRDFMLFGALAEIIHSKAMIAPDPLQKGTLLNTYLEILIYMDSLMFNYPLLSKEEIAANLIKEVSGIYFPKAVEVCFELYKKTKNDYYVGLANFFIERLKTFSLTKDISKRQISLKGKKPLVHKLTDIDNRIRKIKQELILDNEIEKRVYLNLLNNRKSQLIDSVKQVDQNLFSAIFQQQFQPQISISKYFQKYPKSNDSFLQYFMVDTAFYIIFNNKEECLFLKRDFKKKYKNIINTYRKSITTYSLNDNNRVQADSLFQLLVGKQLNEIISKNGVLNIIRNYDLLGIPFESLIYDGKYWVQEQDMQYAFSLKTLLNTLLIDQSNVLHHNPRILAFSFSDAQNKKKGEGVWSWARGAIYGELKGANREVIFLKKSYSNNANRYFFGEDCKKEKFLIEGEKYYDIIHLALHGEATIEEKYTNALIFKDSKNPQKIAKLSIYEIESLSIKASLVVLSACVTNRGKFVSGEGSYSTARAFKKAGASTLIATYWEVEDETTSRLMQSFYENLQKGYKPSIALCNAKRTYLSSADKFRELPFFWAGIICIN